MRGLKPPELRVDADRNTSHLLQMRGLKHNSRGVIIGTLIVASFTDAWIETYLKSKEYETVRVASFTDAWIETKPNFLILLAARSHLLQMRGLKPYTSLEAKFDICRIFYRCVD